MHLYSVQLKESIGYISELLEICN